MVIGKKPRVYKRGDIKNGICKELLKFGKNTKEGEVEGRSSEDLNGERHARKELQAYPKTSADVRIAISPSPEVDLSNQSKNGKSYAVIKEPKRVSPLVEDSVNSGSAFDRRQYSLTTSTVDVDVALHALPFPTKKVLMAKPWPKVDLKNALVHDGSVLYK